MRQKRKKRDKKTQNENKSLGPMFSIKKNDQKTSTGAKWRKRTPNRGLQNSGNFTKKSWFSRSPGLGKVWEGYRNLTPLFKSV